MTVVLLLVLLLLVAINGFFVAAEFALVRSRRGRLEALAAEGDAGVEEALEQLEKIDESLSACQVGITMASIGIGFLGEPRAEGPGRADLRRPLARRRLRARLRSRLHARHVAAHHGRRAGPEDPRDHPRREHGARASRGRCTSFAVVSAPFTLALSGIANAILRLFGVDPRDISEKHTTEDLKEIIGTSAKGGTLDPGEAVMLGGVFHLHEQEAREVMTPIPAVVTCNADETVEDALRAMRQLGPHPAGRDRGRQPRQGPRASSTTTASPAST